jgi:hypothetical protein
MGTTMSHTLEIDGWTWHVSDPGKITPWFGDRERLRRECAVKGGELRDVFRVEVGGAGHYVKYHHPDSLFQKVRSGLAPKAKKEFATARRLLALGLPVVYPVGWGSRGSRSMLLTREVPGAISAREYWFATAERNPVLRKRFLEAFAALLRQMIDAKIHHPDFHLGNLLVTANRKECRFTLVDVYGVTVGEPLDDEERLAMLRIVGALRGELRRGEAIEFFRLHKFAVSYQAADDLWQKILVAEARQMEHLWPKRRRQILAGNPKYCHTMDILGREWRIRRGLDGEWAVSLSQAEEMDWQRPEFEVRHLSPAAAEALWLTSFRLGFHRIHHPQVVAWIVADEGNEDILLLERLDDPVVVEGGKREEFMGALHAAGIRILDHLGSVVNHGGRPALRNPAEARFSS